jgi:hydroxyethylthiazole kinase-like uncharacterized protein yjeF
LIRGIEVLTPEEMAGCDRRAIERGPFDGYGLMQRAGAAVAWVMLEGFGGARQVDVLCGPGNNGGDGYVVAEMLRQSGTDVRVYADGEPREGSDAGLAAAACKIKPRELSAYEPATGAVVVDALYGAGLARPLEDKVQRVIGAITDAGLPVVAVDLPSGISGGSGQVLGAAFRASVTVTFVRKKPAHLLLPGRMHCGEVIVADIGIPDGIVGESGAGCFENGPTLWRDRFPQPAIDAHKYSRGHVAVFSGGATATGAARLSAIAAARTGAGAVTLLSPKDALAANAAHLTSIMLRQADTIEDALAMLTDRKVAACVYGPGLPPNSETAKDLSRILDDASPSVPVIADAGALTALGKEPSLIGAPLGGRRAALVVTPHQGEFARLFPDVDANATPSKVERARIAAKRIGGIVVYKGPDTVIAAPDGRAAINSNGVPWLATAGSGDVLSGIIAGLVAQRMPAFEAACAAVWLHAEAAGRFGPGLIAEDLPLALAPVLSDLYGTHTQA